MHVDVGAAQASVFGGLVATGMHTMAILQRLSVDTVYRGTVDLTVFPARRAEPSVQRGRCRDDNDTERHDRQEEAGSLG